MLLRDERMGVRYREYVCWFGIYMYIFIDGKAAHVLTRDIESLLHNIIQWNLDLRPGSRSS